MKYLSLSRNLNPKNEYRSEIIMDVVELCERSFALASKDEEYLKKIEKLTVSLFISFKDDEDKNFTMIVKDRKMRIVKEVATSDFEFETTTKNFYDVVSGKTAGLIALALGKIKLMKGDLTELTRLIPVLSGLTDFGKKILESEQ